MGARSFAKAKSKPPAKRQGSPSSEEKQIVAALVANSSQEMTPKQVTSLSKVLRRSKEVTQQLIDDAKDNFISSIGDYVALHKQAVLSALDNGDAKSLAVVTAASQWAMQNATVGGTRVVEKEAKVSGGGSIQIGIKIGGLDSTPQNAVSVVQNEPIPGVTI